MRGFVPGRGLLAALVVAGCALTVPALCAAQTDPARPTLKLAAAAPATPARGSVRDLFDWLLGPRENAARPQVPGDTPASSVSPAPPVPDAGTASGSAVVPAERTAPVESGATPATPVQAAPAPDQAAPAAGPASAPAADKPVRSGIALILPAKSTPFGRAGEIARQGFMAARAAAADRSEVRVFETDGTADSARAAFDQAVAGNASVVVGPLTRIEVSGVVRSPLGVPTLVLNTPEGDVTLPPNVFVLSLNVESEARAVAAAAYRADAGAAVIVSSGAPLARRAAAAFADAWLAMGGSIKDTVEFSGSLSRVRQGVERARGDIVFLATDAERARLLRPYLGRNAVVFSTSQVFAGAPRSDAQKPHDLNGLRFVDMPWLHQPDHAATMVFPRPDGALSADLERLYALGIDAYRIAGELVRARTEFTLDGVTGALTVHAGLIAREPLQVEYRDGVVIPAGPR